MDVMTFGYMLFGSHIAAASTGAWIAFSSRIRDARDNAEKMAGMVRFDGACKSPVRDEITDFMQLAKMDPIYFEKSIPHLVMDENV